MSKKFIRGLQYPIASSASGSTTFTLKIAYEFWGFCVNGGASLTDPGGMPTTPTNMPTNFTGGTSLLASGSDGYTVNTVSTLFNGEAIFTSLGATFTSDMVGQLLVMWKPNSNSSEDGIYLITELISPNQIKFNLNFGGTPDPITLHPMVTSRSSINFRIINPATASLAGSTTGNYIVLQLDPTGINAGQANSQAQFLVRSSGNKLGLILSGTGSWTGSAFANDGYTTSEISTVGNGNPGNFSSPAVTINMTGDKDFLIGHLKGIGLQSCSFHLEIPTRLYPQANDLHPIAVLAGNSDNNTVSNSQILHTSFTFQGYGGGFYMKTHNSDTLTGLTSTRNFRTLVKATSGDGTPNVFGGNLSDFRIGFNTFKGTVLASDAILCLPSIPSQFSLARCRLRNVRFTGLHVPSYHRIGPNGEFIQITAGICWPWDNTIVPHVLFSNGF